MSTCHTKQSCSNSLSCWIPHPSQRRNVGSLSVIVRTIGGDGTFNITVTNVNTGITQTFPITTFGASTTTEGFGSYFIPDLTPGRYLVTQSIPIGWRTSTFSFIVDVSFGGTSTVTFVNTRLGILQINKTSIGGDGLYTFNIVGTDSFTTTFSTSFGSGIFITNVLPGTYTVTEQPGLNFFITPPTSITADVTAAGTTVFPFRNTRAGSLTINKTTIGGVTGTFVFSGTGSTGGSFLTTITTQAVTPGGTTGTGSVIVTNLIPGNYQVFEQVPA